MSRKSIRFIVNPVSGTGRQKRIPELVKKQLDEMRFDYSICYTESAGHATELAAEAAREGVDIVAVVGGDGSVNEVGKGLLHTNTAMAIVPTGSGNGLALHLGIPTDPKNAIRSINRHRIRSMDTGQLNEHVFLGVGGIGFDALVADEFSRFDKRGVFSYFKIVLREYFRFKPIEVKLHHRGKVLESEAFLVTAANGSQYGNRATIAPTAVLDDGQLKLCFLSRFPWFSAPFVALRLFRSNIDRSRYMTTMEGPFFQLIHTGKTAHVDGEPVSISSPLTIRVIPSSLNVLVPA